jgi:transcription elongation GreA/GreB family factor
VLSFQNKCHLDAQGMFTKKCRSSEVAKKDQSVVATDEAKFQSKTATVDSPGGGGIVMARVGDGKVVGPELDKSQEMVVKSMSVT